LIFALNILTLETLRQFHTA